MSERNKCIFPTMYISPTRYSEFAIPYFTACFASNMEFCTRSRKEYPAEYAFEIPLLNLGIRSKIHEIYINVCAYTIPRVSLHFRAIQYETSTRNFITEIRFRPRFRFAKIQSHSSKINRTIRIHSKRS